jgi:hypothetical protein
MVSLSAGGAHCQPTLSQLVTVQDLSEQSTAKLAVIPSIDHASGVLRAEQARSDSGHQSSSD